MVFPALLRDSALDARHLLHSSEARRRDGDVRRHLDAGTRALARHVESAFGAIQAALSAVLLGAHPRLYRAWLHWRQGSDAWPHRGRANPHRLLLCPLPHHPAAARADRDAEPLAEF